MKKIIFIFIITILLFFSFIGLIDHFSHIIIYEKNMDNLWQYILILIFSLLTVYPMIKVKKSFYLIISSFAFLVFIFALTFNRLIIVFAHLISEKELVKIETKIEEVIYEHPCSGRGCKACWKIVRIQNFTKNSNNICIFKGNRNIFLKRGNNMVLVGFKSKFGVTYKDFQLRNNIPKKMNLHSYDLR